MRLRVQRFRLGGALVEVLVCIGVIGLLVSVLMPAVQRVREAASQTACRNNLKQIGVAALNYEAVHARMPPSLEITETGGRRHGLQWTHVLLPFIEQEVLYRESRAAFAIDSNSYRNPPHHHLTTIVAVYTCRTDSRVSSIIDDGEGNASACASYFGNEGTYKGAGPGNGAFDVKLTWFTDGTSQTLFVGERPPSGVRFSGSWYGFGILPEWGYDSYSHHLYGHVDYPAYSDPCQKPFQFGPGRIENPCDSHHFWSLHSGGANFAFADGSVRFLKYSAASLIPALATRNGGEAVELPD